MEKHWYCSTEDIMQVDVPSGNIGDDALFYLPMSFPELPYEGTCCEVKLSSVEIELDKETLGMPGSAGDIA